MSSPPERSPPRNVPRSSSSVFFPPKFPSRPSSRPSHFFNDSDSLHQVHLIPVDLWEQISGERLTPAHICELQDSVFQSVPGSIARIPQTEQSLQFIMMARDRNECRTLQQQLVDGDQTFKDLVFDSLMPQFRELVYDLSANYVIQKLCEIATPKQKATLLECFLADLPHIIDHSNGCRVLQKFIECSETPIVDALFVELKPNLITLCLSLNGNHIVRRFIDSLPSRIYEIISLLQPHVIVLVVDNCGCRVIQKLFERFESGSLDPLESLISPILSHSSELATNQYGNYVVQIILTAGVPRYVASLVQQFSTHFYEFSIHKFASNVIEKCIRVATDEQRHSIFAEIIGVEGHFERSRIKKMASDQFGNYVIQRIIEYGNDAQQEEIFDVVDENFNEFANISYSKHVISCLQSLGFRF